VNEPRLSHNVYVGMTGLPPGEDEGPVHNPPMTPARAYIALALNLSWSFVFFGARLIGPALAVIAALLAAILANAFLFWRVDRAAGALLLPYAAWVSFATVLNAALWRLN
jgi:tryptophan-rich sensory protein